MWNCSLEDRCIEMAGLHITLLRIMLPRTTHPMSLTKVKDEGLEVYVEKPIFSLRCAAINARSFRSNEF